MPWSWFVKVNTIFKRLLGHSCLTSGCFGESTTYLLKWRVLLQRKNWTETWSEGISMGVSSREGVQPLGLRVLLPDPSLKPSDRDTLGKVLSEGGSKTAIPAVLQGCKRDVGVKELVGPRSSGWGWRKVSAFLGTGPSTEQLLVPSTADHFHPGTWHGDSILRSKPFVGT